MCYNKYVKKKEKQQEYDNFIILWGITSLFGWLSMEQYSYAYNKVLKVGSMILKANLKILHYANILLELVISCKKGTAHFFNLALTPMCLLNYSINISTKTPLV